jgi:molecular chaperone DnaJ
MDLYELLGLGRGATLIEIKRSYRRLARRYHPDINPGDHAAEAHFKEITRAYETLSNPDLRHRYDLGGAGASAAAGATVEFDGFDFSPLGSEPIATTFGDIFSEIFSSRAQTRTSGPEPGADLHASLTLGFDEAMLGTQRQLTVTRRDRCSSCRGAASVVVTESRCRQCEGSGVVRSRRGNMVFSKTCDACEGTGSLARMPCRVCAGLGVEARTESITVRIPAGVADGARIRVPDKGNAGMRGGRVGDLYIAVQVEASAVFRRDGDDFQSVVPIAVHEAALGAKIEVAAPDGRARLRLPPGTQSGQRFRIRGRGAISPRTGERGDLVVEVRIVLPRLLDERSKELLREFGRINGDDVRKA